MKSTTMHASGKITRSVELCDMSRSCHKRNVLERRHRISANQPRQPGDSLRCMRIALVRHGRRALISFRERLLSLAHFTALQMPDFERHLLERAGQPGQHRQEMGVAVTLDDLGRDRLNTEAERVTDFLLDIRRHMGVRTNGAGDLADRDLYSVPPRVGRAAALSSSYQTSSFMPKVVGSAKTPCVRPIVRVSRCSIARRPTASAARRCPPAGDLRHPGAWIARPVSMTSELVRPR